VPHHSVTPYVQKLLEHGLKVAICEQVETPHAKGIVERKVVRVISRARVLDEESPSACADAFAVAGSSTCSQIAP